ncbi:hypothetical protein VP1G_09924 [Cytospora mali]|uniref:Acyltransferase 3 domain-containing protein n=1 Tax=Cytospora mali TaxID=578113 RepID=A0A194VGA8_CYTMA|nr:hypothetical protein VP1G_09924 [Valsa mali var. pyri (nom. inval.)]
MASTSNNIITLRRHDLDNLKTFLTGLVVVHHTAIFYGGEGSWLRSRLIPRDHVLWPLLIFNGFNQSFFMGLFFWISGRMSAQALNKEDTSLATFLKAKVVRLLVPTVANTLLGPPLVTCLAQGRIEGSIFQDYWGRVRGVRGVTWYTATLFAFDGVAALLHQCLPSSNHSGKERRKNSDPIYDVLKKYGWILAATASFLIRLDHPVGRTSTPFGVQPAYLAQYILAYTLGHLSLKHGDTRMAGLFEHASPSRSDEPTSLKPGTTTAKRSPSLPMAVTISVLTAPVCFLASEESTSWSGGWNLNAVAYAVWNELSFMLIGPALMDHFQIYQGKAATSSLWQAKFSYAVYLIHAPLSVAIEAAVDKGLVGISGVVRIMEHPVGLMLGSMALTGVIGYVNTAASFATGKLLLEVFPSLARVL